MAIMDIMRSIMAMIIMSITAMNMNIMAMVMSIMDIINNIMNTAMRTIIAMVIMRSAAWLWPMAMWNIMAMANGHGEHHGYDLG